MAWQPPAGKTATRCGLHSDVRRLRLDDMSKITQLALQVDDVPKPERSGHSLFFDNTECASKIRAPRRTILPIAHTTVATENRHAPVMTTKYAPRRCVESVCAAKQTMKCAPLMHLGLGILWIVSR